MHELAITEAIIESIQTVLENQKVRSVKQVTLEIGPFSQVFFDQVQFWWNILIENTILEGGMLIPKDLPGKLKCLECDQISVIWEKDIKDKEIALSLFQCPLCSSLKTQIIEGMDVKIGEIEIETVE
ncbi:MAG: hydrogenase maturation nickel metallochaperone HypA [Candidatus Thorarchaeota archaeon]